LVRGPCGQVAIIETSSLRGLSKFSSKFERAKRGIDSRQGAKFAKFGGKKYIFFENFFHREFPTFADLASFWAKVRNSLAALPR
jgi:hypothetical protein